LTGRAGFHGAHHWHSNHDVPIINQFKLDSGSGASADPFDEAFELLDGGKMMIEQFMAGSEHNIYIIQRT
jgi:hypothetical protein